MQVFKSKFVFNFPSLSFTLFPLPYYFIGSEEWNNFMGLVSLVVWLNVAYCVVNYIVFPVKKELFNLKSKYTKEKDAHC